MSEPRHDTAGITPNPTPARHPDGIPSGLRQGPSEAVGAAVRRTLCAHAPHRGSVWLRRGASGDLLTASSRPRLGRLPG